MCTAFFFPEILLLSFNNKINLAHAESSHELSLAIDDWTTFFYDFPFWIHELYRQNNHMISLYHSPVMVTQHILIM